jgi:hypothetical protein
MIALETAVLTEDLDSRCHGLPDNQQFCAPTFGLTYQQYQLSPL